MDLFELDFFRDWDLDQPCHVETERSALKRREWERRTQEVQQDDDLFSSDFNLFGEPYKTNKGDALANRVQNTLGSYEEMKDLLTNQTNQSHLVGIPKGNGTGNLQTPTAAERPALEQDAHSDRKPGSVTAQPPVSTSSQSAGSKKSKSGGEWSRSHAAAGQGSGRGGRAAGAKEEPKHGRGGRAAEEQNSKGGRGSEEQPGRGGRGSEEQPSRGGRVCAAEEQPKREELSLSSREEQSSTKAESSPSSSASCGGRRHSKPLPLSDGVTFRSSTLDVGHFKSSCENAGLFTKTSPFENGSPLASTSLLATPAAALTAPAPLLATPAAGLTTPTFHPGGLSLKPVAVMQKPTAYVRPMDGQDQNPSASPQLKPPLQATEGYSSGQPYGASNASAKNKLPKLSLGHTAEVGLQSDPSCVEEILREMTHSWPPPLTAIHTPVKAEQTKFPIPNKEPQHVSSSSFSVQKRCSIAANKPSTKAPQKSMLEDDLKISSDEEEPEQQGSEKPKARSSALSGGSGSSSESESSSESDTDESESSSSDTTTPEPDPPSSNKWQLDSWLKVQAQPRPAAPPQDEQHSAGSIPLQTAEPLSPEAEAPILGTAAKTKPCGSSSPGASAAEHKDRATFSSSVREKCKSRLGQKGAAEGQRAKVRLSPGVVSGSEVTTPRRATTGRKQPRRDESAPTGEEQEHSWARTNQQSPVSRDKDLPCVRPPEHLTPHKPRSRPPGGKTAPRKEPRTTANNANAANNANTANAALQATPLTPASSASQERRKHRGPSSKTTPKSREFIETESSTSSSESQSDSEETCPKTSAQSLPPQPPPPSRALPAHLHAPAAHGHAPCISSTSTVASLGGKGPRAKENAAIANGIGISSGASVNANGHSHQLGIANISESFGISVPDPGGLAHRNLDQLSPALIVNDIPLSPLRDYEEIQSLWVKIDLTLLSRVPGAERIQNGGFGERLRHEDWARDRERQMIVKMQSDGEEEEEERERERGGIEDGGNVPEKSDGRMRGERDRGEKSKHSRRRSNGANQKHKSKRKHKSDHCDFNNSKKLRLEKETLLPPCISPIHSHKNDPLCRKASRPRDEKLLPPLLSPLSDEPPRGRSCEAAPGPNLASGLVSGPGLNPSPVQEGSSSVALPSIASSSHRHRRTEGKSGAHSGATAEVEGSDRPGAEGLNGGAQSDSETWTEPQTDPDSARPRLCFTDTVHSADFYMQEAKRLKHKADKLLDKFGKAVNYADGALSFIECGTAMERDPLEAKSPYTMYSETVELIRYAMRLKNFSSHSSSTNEKKLSVLCNRCLSLLYLRMFQLKKDHAVKYSRSLMDYFKNSAKSSHQAPSPWRTNGKVNGAPSPLALSPSPAGNGAGPGSGAGSGGGASGSVSIPQKIHHMASSHVSITNHILRSYEHWESADRLSRESPEFFEELDSVMEPLSQQSTMSALVRYVRQGLHWIRLDAHLM